MMIDSFHPLIARLPFFTLFSDVFLFNFSTRYLRNFVSIPNVSSNFVSFMMLNFFDFSFAFMLHLLDFFTLIVIVIVNVHFLFFNTFTFSFTVFLTIFLAKLISNVHRVSYFHWFVRQWMNLSSWTVSSS